MSDRGMPGERDGGALRAEGLLSRFGRDALIYTIPVIAGRATGLITLPIFTRYLTREELGVAAMVTVAFALLNLVLPLEITQGMARSLAGRRGTEDRSRIISTAFWFRAAVFSLAGAAILAAPRLTSRLFFDAPDYAFLAPVVAGYMLLQAMRDHTARALRWTLQPVGAALVGLSRLIGVLGVSVPLVVWMGLGVRGLLLGHVVGAGIAVLVGTVALRRTAPLQLTMSRPSLRRMLAFSAPLVFSSVGVYLSMYLDRWCIAWILDVDSLGPYSVAFTIGAVVNLVMVGFKTALTPLIYEHHEDPDTPLFMRRTLDWFILLTTGMIALVTAANPLIYEHVIGSEFAAGQVCTPWLMLGLALMNVHLFAPGLLLQRQTWRIAGINTFAAAINLAGNLILLPRVGILGAALATIASSLMMATLFTAANQRLYPLPLRLGRYLAILAVLSASILISQSWPLAGLRWPLMAAVVGLAAVLLRPPVPRWRLS